MDFYKGLAIFVFGIAVFMVCMSIAINNIHILDYKNIKYTCSANYIQPYSDCPHEQQFENATGEYCDGRLVCENER